MHAGRFGVAAGLLTAVCLAGWVHLSSLDVPPAGYIIHPPYKTSPHAAHPILGHYANPPESTPGQPLPTDAQDGYLVCDGPMGPCWPLWIQGPGY